MPASLSDLEADEQRLMAEAVQVTGAIEEKEAALRDLGVLDAYRAVHAAYAAQAHASDEALKRALFLQWYVAVEPPAFSGIRDVNGADADRVLAEIERRAESDGLGPELAALVALYHSIAEWYFDRDDLPALRRQIPALDTLRGRGQMSEYLMSMQYSKRVTDRAR